MKDLSLKLPLRIEQSQFKTHSSAFYVPEIEAKPSQVKFDTDRPKNSGSAFLKKQQMKTIDQSHTRSSVGDYFVPSTARRKAVISIKTRQDLIP